MVAGFEASQVRILLAHLHDGQGRLFLLRVVGAEDTGYVLGMSPGAVRVAQHRAQAQAARSPPNGGQRGPPVSALNRMGGFPLPLPVKVP